MTTKEKIKLASFSLLLENGIEGTTTKQLLEASKVSNGTLFHHFPTKEKIVESIYVDIQNELIQLVNRKPFANDAFKQYFWESWDSIVRFFILNPEKYKFYVTFDKSPTIRCIRDNDTLSDYSLVAGIIEEAINNGTIHTLSTDYFLYMTKGAIGGLLEYLSYMDLDYDRAVVEHTFNQYWQTFQK